MRWRRASCGAVVRSTEGRALLSGSRLDLQGDRFDQGPQTRALGDAEPRDGIAGDLGEESSASDLELDDHLVQFGLALHGADRRLKRIVKTQALWPVDREDDL